MVEEPEGNHFENLGMRQDNIKIDDKQGENTCMWIGFMWFGIGYSGELLCIL